jgi:hypothetical protein
MPAADRGAPLEAPELRFNDAHRAVHEPLIEPGRQRRRSP